MMHGPAGSGAAAQGSVPDPVTWPRTPLQRALMGVVRGYQLFFSPWLGSSCRFEPTCSHYALQALDRHGAARGSWLAARRLLRCHPGCAGGHDPVPPRD